VGAAPAFFAGWAVRLALEMPDPIYLFRFVSGKPQLAIGLYDDTRSSLAVVVGRNLYGFGDGSCSDRLVAFLSDPRPLDVGRLQIIATPRRSPENPGQPDPMRRQHFEFEVREQDS
jgi:hypothetical protein